MHVNLTPKLDEYILGKVKSGRYNNVLSGLLALALFQLMPAQAQDVSQREIGTVYYGDGSGFKPIDKVVAAVAGLTTVSATIKGENSAIRLTAGQPQIFRVCGVDPTRYKLYAMKSKKNSRTVRITKVGIFGGSKSVLAESEIPVTIQSADNNCFTITPKESLDRGEYCFSPVDSNELFPFGVGSVKQGK